MILSGLHYSFCEVVHSRRVSARHLHNRIWGLFGNLQNQTLSKNGKTQTCAALPQISIFEKAMWTNWSPEIGLDHEPHTPLDCIG